MAKSLKRIILVGGGTMGSVSPLLAIAAKYPAEYLFIGTQTGPEKEVVQKAGLAYRAIPAGKLRRYWSWQNIVDVFKIKLSFFYSLKIIIQFKPDIILSAGSFVAVPVILAAWFLRIPRIIHQQDIKVGLANKILVPFATKISVTFLDQIKLFPTKKVVVTGNPVRNLVATDAEPIILITGGGLGARGFNNFLHSFIAELTRHYPVHHILGNNNYDQALSIPNYYPHKFVTEEMTDLLARAEIIISRAGMSLATEAAALAKALILIPMPDSHQEANAEFFARNNAAIYVKQGSDKIMDRYLQKIFLQTELRRQLGLNLQKLFPAKPVDNYIRLIEDVLHHK